MARPADLLPGTRPPARARIVRLVGPAVALLALVLWLAAPDRSGAQEAGGDPGAGGRALAAADTAAWNAGDLDAIEALFAADAVVRQRGAAVDVYGPTVAVRDAFGVPLTFVGDPPAAEAGGVVWARGRPAIREWARRYVAVGHQLDATNYQAAAEAVRWDYRATTGFSRRLPGAAPSGGRVELTVQAGAIAALTTESDPTAVRARERSLLRVVAGSPAGATRQGAGEALGTPSPPARGTPTPAAWAAVAGVSLLAVIATAAVTRPTGRAERQ